MTSTEIINLFENHNDWYLFLNINIDLEIEKEIKDEIKNRGYIFYYSPEQKVWVICGVGWNYKQK